MMTNPHNLWIIRVESEKYRAFVLKGNRVVGQSLTNLMEKHRTGERVGEDWKTPEMILFPGEQGHEVKESRKPIGDFFQGVISCAISEKAQSIMCSIIDSQVEFLPISTEVGKYYEMNVKRIDCLDEERSEIKNFSDGTILRVIRYGFFWDCLDGINIFRVPGIPPIFVSDIFKDLVEKNHLKGITFFPVPMNDL